LTFFPFLRKKNAGFNLFNFFLDTNMEEIQAKVVKIISEQLGKDQSEISMSSNFIEDLDADSLDTVELVMALEEEFEVDIPDEAAEKITTVQSAVDYIKEAKA